MKLAVTKRALLAVVVVALACGGGDDGGGDGAGGDGGDGLTHGSGQQGEACERHRECAAGLMCAPAGTCFEGTIGDMECKATQDCANAEICDERFTRCEVGECGHDLDCASGDCDFNGLQGEPFSCVP